MGRGGGSGTLDAFVGSSTAGVAEDDAEAEADAGDAAGLVDEWPISRLELLRCGCIGRRVWVLCVAAVADDDDEDAVVELVAVEGRPCGLGAACGLGGAGGFGVVGFGGATTCFARGGATGDVDLSGVVDFGDSDSRFVVALLVDGGLGEPTAVFWEAVEEESRPVLDDCRDCALSAGGLEEMSGLVAGRGATGRETNKVR